MCIHIRHRLGFTLVSPRIHGGYDGVDLYQDTWRFDSQAAGVHAWSRISSVSGVTGEPSARAKHVGAWDPAGAFWIHGGYNGSTLAAGGCATLKRVKSLFGVMGLNHSESVVMFTPWCRNIQHGWTAVLYIVWQIISLIVSYIYI